MFVNVLGIRLSQNYKYFFGKCVSNEKTSILEMIRGFGILYLISIIAIIIQYNFTYNYEAGLVIASVILGFLDDKVNISQNIKF